MAKVRSSVNLLAICLIFLLIANMEMEAEGYKLCSEYSELWRGYCGDSSKCDHLCTSKEGAHSGACHFDFPGFACFCYFKCG